MLSGALTSRQVGAKGAVHGRVVMRASCFCAAHHHARVQCIDHHSHAREPAIPAAHWRSAESFAPALEDAAKGPRSGDLRQPDNFACGHVDNVGEKQQHVMFAQAARLNIATITISS
jgi:hypothetical protein